MATAFRNRTGCSREKQQDSRKERHNPSQVQICSERSLHLSNPRVSRSLISVTPGEEGSASAAHTEVSARNCHHFRACKGRKGRGEEVGHTSCHLQGHMLNISEGCAFPVSTRGLCWSKVKVLGFFSPLSSHFFLYCIHLAVQRAIPTRCKKPPPFSGCYAMSILSIMKARCCLSTSKRESKTRHQVRTSAAEG